MDIAVFILMNLIIASSALLVVLRLLRIGDFIDLLISWFIVSFAQITLSQLLLGIFGGLHLKYLILLNLFILISIWLLSKKYGPGGEFSWPKKMIRELFNDKITCLIIALFLGFLAVKLAVNLVNPPFGWDSLNYHYTFPVEWIRNANLVNPIVISEDPFPAYYPINGSLFFLWLIFPFKSAFFADLGQLPFFIVALLAVYKISRRLGVAREHSFLAAVLFVLMPNFFKQIEWGYVDIMICAMFLSALNYLLSFRKSTNLTSLFLFSLTLGLGIGIKTTVAPYMLLLVLPFILILLCARQISFLKRSGYIAFFALIALCLGGYGYIRNLILTGNPLYPLDIVIAGRRLFSGVIDRAAFTFRNEEHGHSLAKLLFHEGVGAQTVLFGLLGIIAFPINFFIRKDKRAFLNYILLLPILLYLTYRFILPIANTRYFYPGLAVAMICGFFALSALKVPIKFLKALSLIIILASLAESARHISLALSFAISFLIYFLFIYLNQGGLRLKRKTRIILIVSFFALVGCLKIMHSDYLNNEYARYISNSRYWPDATAAWEWLNRKTSSDNIAYVGRPVPYPLYGTSFKNNVYYVSVNKKDPINLHDLGDSRYRWSTNEGMHQSFKEAGNYRGQADYADWHNNLKSRETDYLFIYSFLHTEETLFPMEEDWARMHPDAFEPVFTTETVKVYKVQ